MNWTRFLMSASAVALGIPGMVCTFAPEIVLQGIGTPPSRSLMLMVQLLGALYLGFAGLNWMARENLIGGIYSRPVAIGNLMHFLVAALAMIKLLAAPVAVPLLLPLAIPYAAFAAAFGYVLFRHPVRSGQVRSTTDRQ